MRVLMFCGVALTTSLLIMTSGRCHLFAGDQAVEGMTKGEQVLDADSGDSKDSAALEESDVSDHFGQRVVARGKEYRKTKYLVFFVRMAISLTFLALVVKFGWMEWLSEHAGTVLPERPWLRAGVYAALLTITLTVVTLPLSLYSSYFHEHSFGLSTRNLAGWFSDLGTYTLIQVFLAFLLFAVFYRIMQAFPSWWWLVSAFCFSLFLVFMTAVSPLVIAPLFNKFSPVEDNRLKQEIIELSEKAGLHVENVLEMNASKRTKKLNAYFTGIGNTKRVVLYDNLLDKGSTEEVMMVLAHELGHWRRNHLWKGLGLAVLGTVVVLLIIRAVLTGSVLEGLGVEPLYHPSGVPTVMLIIMLLGFVSMPLQNAISRYFERQADMDSLLLTGDPDTFIRVEERIGKTNLNDIDPNPVIKWILFTHPPTIDRIRMAENFREERQ